MAKKTTPLQVRYEKVCNEYIKQFCQKQDVEFGYWINNVVGETSYIDDYFFDFQDIAWDINSNQPKGCIISWYNDNLIDLAKSINYYSYTKGLRVENL